MKVWFVEKKEMWEGRKCGKKGFMGTGISHGDGYHFFLVERFPFGGYYHIGRRIELGVRMNGGEGNNTVFVFVDGRLGF